MSFCCKLLNKNYFSKKSGLLNEILGDLLKLTIIVIVVVITKSDEVVTTRSDGERDKNKDKEIFQFINKLTDLNGKLPCMEDMDDEDTIEHAENSMYTPEEVKDHIKEVEGESLKGPFSKEAGPAEISER